MSRKTKPVAQLAPKVPEPESLFGYMKDTVLIMGDIVSSSGERWHAESQGADASLANLPSKRSARRETKRP